MMAFGRQELLDAEQDLGSLSDLMNGSKTLNGNGVVVTRLGQRYRTLAKLLSDINAAPPPGWTDALRNAGLTFNNKGDPGAVGGTPVGTMVQLATMNISAGTDVIRTTGFYGPGDGGDGWYRLMPAGTMGGVGSTANGRVAVNLPEMGIYNALAWGARADATDVGGSQGCTDNLSIIQKIIQYCQTSITSAYIAGPRIRFPGAAGYYYYSDTLVLRKTVLFEGDSYGFETFVAAQPTKFTWPKQTIGLQLERYDTDGNNAPIKPTQTGADGSSFRGIVLCGGGYTGATGDNPADVVAGLAKPTYHAIWSKVRFDLDRVLIANWTGNGVYMNAAETSSGASRGNANEFHFSQVMVVSVGGWAYWFQNGDNNAGTTIKLGWSNCGLGGINEMSFLGNNHVGPHGDSWGRLGLGTVRYSGSRWLLVSTTPGVGGASAPGSSGSPWLLLGAEAGNDTWVSGGNYQCSCGILSTGANARSLFSGVYLEGGYPHAHVAAPSLIMQYQGPVTKESSTVTPAFGVGGFMNAAQGHGSFRSLPDGDARGNYALSYVAYDGLHIATPNSGEWRLGISPAGMSVIFANLYTPTRFLWKYTRQGLSAQESQEVITSVRDLYIGLYDTAISTGSAPPTTGVSQRGDVRFNTSAAPGSPPAWICTTTGTNGSTSVWKAFAAVAA